MISLINCIKFNPFLFVLLIIIWIIYLSFWNKYVLTYYTKLVGIVYLCDDICDMDLISALQSLMTLFAEQLSALSADITACIKSKVTEWMDSQAAFIQALCETICRESETMSIIARYSIFNRLSSVGDTVLDFVTFLSCQALHPVPDPVRLLKERTSCHAWRLSVGFLFFLP